MSGWIKLHRKITDSKYGKNLEMMGFFAHLLLRANYKEGFTADGTKLVPGQFMTSQLVLAEDFNVSRQKIQRLLSKLVDAKQIEQQSSPKNTIITITNWHLYQEDEQQVGTERATSGQQAGTNKKANKGKKGKNNSSPTLFEVEPLQIEEERVEELPSKIITALNTICFKAFRPTEFNLGFINSRLKDGYKYEDFVAVIKVKNEEWANDPKMRSYLQPSTLFNGKFDQYLNQAHVANKGILDDEEIRGLKAREFYKSKFGHYPIESGEPEKSA